MMTSLAWMCSNDCAAMLVALGTGSGPRSECIKDGKEKYIEFGKGSCGNWVRDQFSSRLKAHL